MKTSPPLLLEAPSTLQGLMALCYAPGVTRLDKGSIQGKARIRKMPRRSKEITKSDVEYPATSEALQFSLNILYIPTDTYHTDNTYYY